MGFGLCSLALARVDRESSTWNMPSWEGATLVLHAPALSVQPQPALGACGIYDSCLPAVAWPGFGSALLSSGVCIKASSQNRVALLP